MSTELFYTKTHEWISFTNGVAFIGITHLKVSTSKRIDDIAFIKIYGVKQKGEVFATIKSNREKKDVRMPVTGKVLSLNDNLLIDKNGLLSRQEVDNWLIKILVVEPEQNTHLLSFEKYAEQYFKH